MAVYLWQARTKLGEVRSGEMEGASPEDVRRKLTAQALEVDKVKRRPAQLNIRMPGSTGITSQDMVVFTRQFATMIDAGLPLVQCLDILGTQNPNPELKKTVLAVKATVEGGSSLAEALGKHPKVFNRLFVNLVAAGEAGGVLDTILNRLAQYIEKNSKLVKQIKGALTYPIMVVVAGIVVSIVLLVFVIPMFQDLFSGMGRALPAPTQMVVDSSKFLTGNAKVVFPSLIGAVVGGIWFFKRPKVQAVTDRVLLRAPLFGPLVQKIAVAKFSRTLSTMLSSGVNILEALEIVASTAGNVVVEQGLLKVRQSISEGQTMAVPLSQLAVFPPMVVQMISVGESTGQLDAMLAKIADFYDDEVDAAVTTFMTALEPLIMSFLAVLLGGLVISMYLPIFSLAGGGGH